MAGLRNKHADMEIGYVGVGKQKKLISSLIGTAIPSLRER